MSVKTIRLQIYFYLLGDTIINYNHNFEINVTKNIFHKLHKYFCRLS